MIEMIEYTFLLTKEEMERFERGIPVTVESGEDVVTLVKENV